MLRLVGRSFLVGVITLAASAALAQEGEGQDPAAGPNKTPLPVTGEQIFTEICAACHMGDAKGATGAATMPALANNPRLANAGYPITVVLFGLGGMPSLSGLLPPAQVANVVGYIRTNFGNNYAAPVTEADVKAIASQHTAAK